MPSYDDSKNYQHVINVITPKDGWVEASIWPQGGSVDGAGRLRVSNPATLFDSQLQYDLSPLFWETSAPSGTVSHVPNESSARMRITGPGQSLVRQTRQYYRYQSGKGQKLASTFVIPTLAAGVTRRIGYFDAENGVFLKVTGQTVSFVIRSNVSGTPDDTREFAQADWNMDKFNGQGISGKTLNITKAQILIIDLEWLGVGRVRVGFQIDGAVYYAHQFGNANEIDSVYMTTANLPARYEISSDGSAAAANHDLIQICTEISSEGGQTVEQGIPFSEHNASGTVSVTTRRPLLSYRPKSLFNSISNRGIILPEGFVAVSVDALALVEIVFGGSLTGGAWSSVDDASIAEANIGATAISGGITLLSFLIPAASLGSNPRPASVNSPILSKLPLSLNIAGAHPTTPYTDSISLVATSLEGATGMAAVANWRELR